MSFAAPLVLLALLAIPLLGWWYGIEQRQRRRAAGAFVTPALQPSVAPEQPRWRRHAPMAAFALALAALVLAAARPQRSVAVPLTDGAVMLADDVSSSMGSTDVTPSRLRAALQADKRFLDAVPGSIRVGLLEFARRPTLMQSPTTDLSVVRAALRPPRLSGGTAIGDAISMAARVLTSLRSPSGKRPPGAIVLLSDGASNVGPDPLAAARRAAAAHIPIYTVAVGTPQGTITVRRGPRVATVPVPVSTEQLAQLARASGGRSFTAGDAGGLSAVYAHLAAELGHKHIRQEISSSFAGGGLVLLLLGSVLSLRWFGRLV
jgi:Ca-activated chloride channel family protein